MPWPIAWLEALGLLAVVFAAGNGLGFALSRLLWPKRRRARARAARVSVTPVPIAPPPPEPAPADAAPAPEAIPRDPRPPIAGAKPPETRPQEIRPPEMRPQEMRPQEMRPQEMRPQEIRRPLVTLRLAYPVNSFGGTSETRSNLEDQPSS